jgi:hypothetical protein
MSEPLRKRVWDEWLSAEIRANYFAELAGIYHHRQRLSTWLTLFTSSGAAGTFLARLPEAYAWVPPLLAVVTAGLSLYSVVAQNHQRAGDCADLHFRWNRLAMAYRALWDNMEAPDVAAQFGRLDDEAAAVSKAGNGFPASTRRLRKWQRHVVRHRVAHGNAA